MNEVPFVPVHCFHKAVYQNENHCLYLRSNVVQAVISPR
jgi:hypothetical protein